VTTKDLINEAVSLPVEQRVRLVDALLQTLNPPEAEVDREWAAVAQRRLAELREGKVEPVSGDEVFQRIRKRFEE
jgi:putative addiction module component (TIGR02574 family)